MFAASKSGSVSEPTDSKFNYVTMLLHGNGTNGAQNNTFLDSSTNNFTITRNGNTTQGTFTPYGSNWSNYFDGSGDYLSVANNAALQWSTGDFCVEAWIYPNSISGSKAIVCKGTNDAGTFDLGLYGAKIELYTTALVFSSSASLSANTWTHVAVTRSGTTLRCFINGVLDTTVTSSYNFNNAGTFYVGVYGSASVNYFNGYMSNVRCVKGSAVYTSAFTPSTTPLTAITNTSLLTCQSNRFIDNSTNNFTITKNGDVSVQRFSPFSPTTAYSTSVIGGSGYFDGSGDYLSAANATALQLSGSQFTIEGWFYLTVGSTDNNELVCQSSGSADSAVNYQIRVTSTNKLRFLVMSGASPTYIDSPTTITTNSWHHFACVCDGSGAGAFLRMWVDGVYQTASSSFNASGINTNTAATQIGAWTFSSQYVTGYISDFRILKGTALYTGTSNITVPTAPLTAITNTSLLLSYTNAGILDNAMMNDLETVGNAQISTSVKKYGTGSMAFDGTGDGLIYKASPLMAFGTGDFTIEFWVYPNANQSNYTKYLTTGNSSGNLVVGQQTTANQICIDDNASVILSSSSNLSNTAWTHVAIVRSGTTLTMYFNGVSVGSTTNSTNWGAGTGSVGCNNAGAQSLNGYIDDLRITKGYARYTSNFTAPTAAFADKG